MKYHFIRFVRTTGSEHWLIRNGSESLGVVDIHAARHIQVNIVLVKELTYVELQHLRTAVEEDLVESFDSPRDDLIMEVYLGRKIASYSDDWDASAGPASKKDLEEALRLLRQAVGRQQVAKSQLNEFVLCEYFEKLGYEARRASEELDHKKVDVEAWNADEHVFCQVKLGEVTDLSMKTIAKYIAQKVPTDKKKIVAIAAKTFPMKVEQIRRRLEQEHEVALWCIYLHEITRVLERYKRSLGG